MTKYWKKLGLKRAPATLKLLDMAYNTRLETLIRADDTDGIGELHKAYKIGKKKLNAVLESDDEVQKAPRRKRAPTRRKSVKKTTKVEDLDHDNEDEENDDGLSLDDFITNTPPPASKPEIVLDYKKDPAPNGFDELAKELEAKNEEIIKKEKVKQKKAKQKKTQKSKGLIGYALSGLKDFYARYFTFSARTSRSDFWGAIAIIGGISFLFMTWVSLATTPYNGLENYPGHIENAMTYYSIFIFFNIIPMLAIILRRLHDIGKGGGWMCLLIIGAFIPVVQVIALIVGLLFMLRKGEDQANQYGPVP